MKHLTLSIFLFLFLTHQSILGQEVYTHSENITMKNGIYLTVEEFRQNKPSFPLTAISNQKDDFLESSICTDEISYVLDGEIKHIKAKDIWGLSINGVPYVKHKQNEISPFRPNNCFYRIFKVGAISTYFVQVIKESNSSAWGNGLYNPNFGNYPSRNPNDVKVKIMEYAIDLKTGETYDQKNDFKKLVRIIKGDEHFSNQKIKKKDIGIFITQYNQRNPLGVETN